MSKAAELAALIGSQTALSNRNLIINGAMQVAQRGTSTTSITSDTYPACDRWHTQINSCGTWTASQSTTVPSGQGFTSSFKLECTTADASPAAGDYVLLNQRIEAQNLQHLAFGTSSAKAVTLSFWIRSNKTGTIANEIYHHDAQKHFNSNFTIDSANTWEHKKITIDGNTADIINNDNGLGFLVYWWFASGSSYNTSQSTGSWNDTNANRATTYNLADTVGNEVYVTGVQLEIGEQATSFEHRSFGDELARCQRYYQTAVPATGDVFGTRIIFGGHIVSGNNTFGTVSHIVPMRAAPTITFNNLAFNGYPTGDPTLNGYGLTNFEVYKTANANNNGSYYLFGYEASAEL
jgi:hypothetical protein